MSNDLERIEQMAHRMRSAIEAVARQDLPLGMRSFPTAACGDSALLVRRQTNGTDLTSD